MLGKKGSCRKEKEMGKKNEVRFQGKKHAEGEISRTT
jgi:hypothetical protein